MLTCKRFGKMILLGKCTLEDIRFCQKHFQFRLEYVSFVDIYRFVCLLISVLVLSVGCWI